MVKNILGKKIQEFPKKQEGTWILGIDHEEK